MRTVGQRYAFLLCTSFDFDIQCRHPGRERERRRGRRADEDEHEHVTMRESLLHSYIILVIVKKELLKDKEHEMKVFPVHTHLKSK